MILRGVLRVAAIAIAAAGVVDPTFTRELPIRERLTIVPIGTGADAPARALQASLTSDYDTVIHAPLDPSRTAACPATGGCVIVSTGGVPDRVTAGATVIGGLRVRAPENRIIAAVDAAPRVHLDAASLLHVTLERAVARVDVYDEGILVGSAPSPSGTTVTVHWVPVEEGARALRAVAGTDSADVPVIVEAGPIPLLFYEPQATWLGTFVRRAVEDDERFSLRGRTQVAPGVAATRGGSGRLTAESLGDVSIVVVAAPEALTAAEVDLLERFVTRRGGSLVLIPDRRPSGPILRLLPRTVEERRQPQASVVGPLRASEMLLFDRGPGTSILATTSESGEPGGRGTASKPVVVARALGRGRVLMSGALDAWRYRDERFDAYWTGVLWDAGAAAGSPLRIVTRSALARPGDTVHVEVEAQSMDAVSNDVMAEGTFDCGNERGRLRLWPQARSGTFAGVFRPTAAGRCRLDVSAAGLSASAPVLVAPEVRGLPVSDERLAAVVAAHGGVMVNPGDEDELRAHIREVLPPRRQRTSSKPMHSPLWIVPFVACLAAEWWSRRRAGLH